MLEYAGLPKWLPFPYAVQHGWQSQAHDFEALSSPPEIWVWSNRIADDLQRFYPRKRIRVVGSFFYYFLRLKEREVNPIRKGSILMPTHSSHHISATYSAQSFSDRASKLPTNYKPITVMIYYLDIDPGLVSAYEVNNFDVTSNGTLYSDDFIPRFYNSIKNKAYIVYGLIGSGVFYSVACGLIPCHIKTNVSIVNNDNKHISDDYISQLNEMDDFLSNKVTDEYVRLEMGYDNLLSRREVRILILKGYFNVRFVFRLFRGLFGFLRRKTIGFLKKM